MLSGAHLCQDKSGYIEYLATDSACEKVRVEGEDYQLNISAIWDAQSDLL